MQPAQVVQCPVDGRPCAPGCSIRRPDRPAGGCFLTAACELGGRLERLGGGLVAVVFEDGPEEG